MRLVPSLVTMKGAHSVIEAQRNQGNERIGMTKDQRATALLKMNQFSTVERQL